MSFLSPKQSAGTVIAAAMSWNWEGNLYFSSARDVHNYLSIGWRKTCNVIDAKPPRAAHKTARLAGQDWLCGWQAPPPQSHACYAEWWVRPWRGPYTRLNRIPFTPLQNVWAIPHRAFFRVLRKIRNSFSKALFFYLHPQHPQVSCGLLQ